MCTPLSSALLHYNIIYFSGLATRMQSMISISLARYFLLCVNNYDINSVTIIHLNYKYIPIADVLEREFQINSLSMNAEKLSVTITF